jgi:hypothetical protein
MFIAQLARLVDFTLQQWLPSMFHSREFADASIPDLFRRGTAYIDKILRGSKPADLPVEQPTKFELVINLEDCAHAARACRRGDRVSVPGKAGAIQPVPVRSK